MKAYVNIFILIAISLIFSCKTKKQAQSQSHSEIVLVEPSKTIVKDSISKEYSRPYYPWLKFETVPYSQSPYSIKFTTKEIYELAFNELKDMLEGKKEPDFERAVFLSENPFHNGKFTYDAFQNSVTDQLLIIQKLIAANDKSDSIDFNAHVNQYGRFKLADIRYLPEQKRELYRQSLSNWAIFKYLTDTVYMFGIKDSILSAYYHTPYSYAINDPFGMKNWSHSQVMGLLISDENQGNCFALTALYKILSDRLKADARICTAPQHIYIQHKDAKGRYYNVELATAGHPGDGIIQTLTYTPTEAIMSGVALRDYTTKQSIGLCLVNLAKSYEHKFKTKDNEFILRCAEQALAHDSLNLNAILLKQQVLDSRVTSYAIKKHIGNIQTLKKDTIICKTVYQLERHLTRLQRLGYKQMPVDMQEMIMNPLRYDPKNWNHKSRNPRPFTSFEPKDPKDAEYWTLTKGMFQEVFEPTEREDYGHFTISNKTHKIVGIDTLMGNTGIIDPVAFAYDFGARIYDARVGHFVSVDPLAKGYPSISPYAYVANNPISFTDKDGKVIWDPQAKKEVIFNAESKKFTYKDGTELSETYRKQAMPTLEKLTTSKVGMTIINSFQAVSTNVIIDETHEQKNSSDRPSANSLVLPSRKKNSDGLYKEAIITPLWGNIEENAKKDNMSVEEKLLATMTVEWGHIGSKAQIDLESSVGGPDGMYSDPTKFATAYNGLLNDAIKNEIAYRTEKGIAIDEGVFQPILRVQQSAIGSKVEFNAENKKAYDDYKQSQH